MEWEEFNKPPLPLRILSWVLPLFVVFYLLDPFDAWLSRSLSLPPQLESAWLDPADSTVHFVLNWDDDAGDRLNINALFIAATDVPAPEAARCQGEGDRIEPTHFHSHGFAWHILWTATREQHFPGFSHDAALDIGSFRSLSTGPVPEDVLAAIDRGEAVLIVAMDEKQFTYQFISLSRAAK